MKRHINRFILGQVGPCAESQFARQPEPGPLAKLPPPNCHYLSASQGWLGLGDWKEAEKELTGIAKAWRDHPSVLETRYQIFAMAKKWTEALETCRTITQKTPDRAFGWLYLSLVLNEMAKTKEAYETLFRVLHRFPKDPLMRYSMACFSCKMGLLSEASIWLRRAFEVGDAYQLMAAALTDTDLEPMWSRMGVESSKK